MQCWWDQWFKWWWWYSCLDSRSCDSLFTYITAFNLSNNLISQRNKTYICEVTCQRSHSLQILDYILESKNFVFSDSLNYVLANLMHKMPFLLPRRCISLLSELGLTSPLLRSIHCHLSALSFMKNYLTWVCSSIKRR